MPGWDEHPRAGHSDGDPSEMPADLAAVQADDALLDMIGAGHAPSDADDELTRLLAAWRHEVHAEPVKELVDTSTALALIRAAARRSARRRNPVFGSIAGAAAVVVIAFSSVGLVAKSAEPGDPLWGVTQVLYRDYAHSVETAAAVRTELNEANTALQQGRPQRAREALQRIRQQLPAVREDEGRTELATLHGQLEKKLNWPADAGPMDLPGMLVPPPAPESSRPGATKPDDPKAPSAEGSTTKPGTAGDTPGRPAAPTSDDFWRGRGYPGPHYPYPDDAGAGRPGHGGAHGNGRPSERNPAGRDSGSNSSEGKATSGSPGEDGTPSPRPSPRPSRDSEPADADSEERSQGQGGSPHPSSRDFPGCDRPPPRPGYCG